MQTFQLLIESLYQVDARGSIAISSNVVKFDDREEADRIFKNITDKYNIDHILTRTVLKLY